MLRPVAQKECLCGERSFSAYEFAINIIERNHVAVFVEEEDVSPVRHDEFIRWEH